MNAPAGWTRLLPSPVAPCPIDRLRPSPVPMPGRWQVMQAMSLFPLRILSKASARPSSTSSALTGAGRSRGPMPRPAVRDRTSSTSVGVGDSVRFGPAGSEDGESELQAAIAQQIAAAARGRRIQGPPGVERVLPVHPQERTKSRHRWLPQACALDWLRLPLHVKHATSGHDRQPVPDRV